MAQVSTAALPLLGPGGQDSSKGGAVETGCSDLNGVTH